MNVHQCSCDLRFPARYSLTAVLTLPLAPTIISIPFSFNNQKLADSLVNGKVLWIEGGEYTLCDTDDGCGKGCCRRRCRHDKECGK